MPNSPTTKKQVFSALATFAGKVGEAFGVEGAQTAADSLSAYTQLESLMKQINLSLGCSLRDKKAQFLREAPQYISKLTTADLVKLYNVYKNDPLQEKRYAFIYSEDTHKPIGWIKYSIFDVKEPTGNTDTHKKFLELLKKRALANIQRHNAPGSQRTLPENSAELQMLGDLMSETRGRFPNIGAEFGGGLEGKFKAWGV